MGLIKGAVEAVGKAFKPLAVNVMGNAVDSASTVISDQYLEYFYNDAFPEGVLATKGKNRMQKGFNKGSENIISNGSIIEVNAGQAALIIDDGQVAEFCAEPGQYRYDQSSQPSIFYGKLGENIKNTFAEIGKRIAFGGERSKTQKVYYININEVRNNLWGTTNPIPFFIADQVTGFQGDISLIANGEYTFHISDPIRFYSSIATNFVGDAYTKKDLQSIMRSDFMTALQPALGALSDYGVGIRYSAITTKTTVLVEKLNEQLSTKWGKLRGMEVLDVTFNTLKATEEDEKRIKQFQDTAVFTNVNMAAARMTTAQANAMEAAASNESTGPMMAFAGLNMAQQAGGMNAANLFAMGQQQQQAQMAAPSQAVNGWSCSCGKAGNTGRFCAECGAKKPDDAGWKCNCGQENQGKFCANCGAKKPDGAPLYKCDKCGWEPADPMNPPKFCPQCGDIFDDNDKQ